MAEIKQISLDLNMSCSDWSSLISEETFSTEVSDFLTQYQARLQPVIDGQHVWKMCENIDISLVLADDEMLQHLNNTYRGQDKPTNVLSFSQLEDYKTYPVQACQDISLGDIVIAYQTVMAEAQLQGKTGIAHLKHMIVHGVLHLLGYDHETSEEADVMETLECDILKLWGVENPYL